MTQLNASLTTQNCTCYAQTATVQGYKPENQAGVIPLPYDSKPSLPSLMISFSSPREQPSLVSSQTDLREAGGIGELRGEDE